MSFMVTSFSNLEFISSGRDSHIGFLTSESIATVHCIAWLICFVFVGFSKSYFSGHKTKGLRLIIIDPNKLSLEYSKCYSSLSTVNISPDIVNARCIAVRR